MISVCLGSKGEYNNSLDTNLPNAFQSFGAQEFPKLHSKAGRYLFFVSFLIDCVEPNTIFDENECFVL